MRVRTPQDKKRASYLLDRQNEYGQHDKASRKAIPRNKRRVSRAKRRHDASVLHAVRGELSREVADDMASKLDARALPTWGKHPDDTLGDALMYRLARRANLGISAPATMAAKIELIRRRMRQSGRRCAL